MAMTVLRIGEKANKTDIMMGACGRPHNQDEEKDKIF